MTRKFEISKTISKNSDIEILPEIKQTGNVLINIRGSNGSGKSYTVRKIIENFGTGVLKTIDVPSEKHGTITFPYYEYDDFFLLGSYERDCGGLDVIRDFYVIAPMVKDLIRTKSVIMEGILWSSVFSAMYRLDRELRAMGHVSVWCGFNHPCELHLERIMERRARAGKFEPMQIKHVLEKIKSTEKGLNHAIFYGANVLIGPTEYLAPIVADILKNNSIEGVDFEDNYHFVPDLEKWNEIYRSNREYKYSPSDELVKKYSTTNSLLELF